LVSDGVYGVYSLRVLIACPNHHFVTNVALTAFISTIGVAAIHTASLRRDWSFLHDAARRTEALDRSNYLRCSWWGPRKTGKGVWVKPHLPAAAVSGLLKQELERRKLPLELS